MITFDTDGLSLTVSQIVPFENRKVLSRAGVISLSPSLMNKSGSTLTAKLTW